MNVPTWILEMERFCAYQERSPFEIRKKLLRKSATEEQVNLVIRHLSANNFLNEERFVKAYVEGKQRIKGWGKQKIKAGLKAHNVSEELVAVGLSCLDAPLEKAQIQRWYEKKMSSLSREAEGPKKKAKIIRYLLSKGFTLDEIMPLFKLS